MLKKIIENVVKTTKCYLTLKKHCIEIETENEIRQHIINNRTKLVDKAVKNAKKIKKILNANFDKKDKNIKEIKTLCQEIIKGED